MVAVLGAILVTAVQRELAVLQVQVVAAVVAGMALITQRIMAAAITTKRRVEMVAASAF